MKPRAFAMRRHLRLAPAAVVLLATAAPAQESRVEDLERNLRERDKVIAELLDRVDALERRVGAERVQPEPRPVPTPAPSDVVVEPTPGWVVVEEGEAERALERSLTQAGALLLPSGVVEIEPSLSYARLEDTAPRLFLDEGRITSAETERDFNSVTGNLDLRLGLPGDAQFELGLPYRWREVEDVTTVGFAPIDTSTASASGLGDVRVGFAKTLLRENLWQPDLVGRVTWDTDTGDRADDGVGLGGGFHELRGSLTAIKRQDPVAFVGGLSYEHAFGEDDIGPGETYAANFGIFIALSPETSLHFGLSGAYQDETELFGTEIDGSDRVIGTFTVGGSTLLAPGTLLNLSAGIGLTEDADDVSVLLSLPIRLGEPIF